MVSGTGRFPGDRSRRSTNARKPSSGGSAARRHCGVARPAGREGSGDLLDLSQRAAEPGEFADDQAVTALEDVQQLIEPASLSRKPARRRSPQGTRAHAVDRDDLRRRNSPQYGCHFPLCPLTAGQTGAETAESRHHRPGSPWRPIAPSPPSPVRAACTQPVPAGRRTPPASWRCVPFRPHYPLAVVIDHQRTPAQHAQRVAARRSPLPSISQCIRRYPGRRLLRRRDQLAD